MCLKPSSNKAHSRPRTIISQDDLLTKPDKASPKTLLEIKRLHTLARSKHPLCKLNLFLRFEVKFKKALLSNHFPFDNVLREFVIYTSVLLFVN